MCLRVVSRGLREPPPIRFVQALLSEFVGSLFLALCMALAMMESNFYIAYGAAVASLQYR